MKFVSTRGECPSVDFRTAFLQGYAPDGGMYLPDHWPELPYKQWTALTYPQIVANICKLFMDEPDMPIDDFCTEVYAADKWSHPDIAPVVCLEGQLFLQELFHGSTWAFKDYSLALLGKIMNWYLQRDQERRIVLIATSGDTGSAAMSAVAGQSHVDMLVLMPAGSRISRIQRLQMTTQLAPNLYLYEADCTSDELDQLVVVPVYSDSAFCDQHRVGCLNSVNIGRVLVQMAHWLYAHLAHPQALFAVPTGAAGNATAAALLRQMGVPLQLVVCTNTNKVMHTLVQTGCLCTEPIVSTMACAIDIGQPYNVERLIWMCSGGQSALTASIMRHFYSTGKCQLPSDIHKKLRELIVDSVSVSESEIQCSVERAHTELHYDICPHTATALHYAFTHHNTQRPLICVATASPQKFYDVYDRMPSIKPAAKSDRLLSLEQAPEKTPFMLPPDKREQWAELVRQRITDIHKMSLKK